MMINAISSANVVNVNSQVKKLQNAVVTNPIQEKRVKENSDNGALKSYFLGSVSFGKKKPDPIKNYVNSLPFADDLSPQDKRNLGNVLRKKDEETDYMKKMIHLVCKNMVTPYATAALCKHGKMSDIVKEDIDTYYDKVKEKKMSIKDAFVPQHASEEAGKNASKVGDVFRVEGQDRIFIKSGDDSSKQLKMDADTYLKLYPPVERYSSCQGANGDCYLLSTINSIMENPYARTALYECFTQEGNNITIQLPDSPVKVTLEDGKLPKGADYEKYSDGPLGMKLLEHAYGLDFEQNKYNEYKQVMSKEYEKMERDLAKWQKKQPQDNLALKKQKEITERIANWKSGEAKVDAAMQDPEHKLTFVLDDYDDFVIGKWGPMTENVNELDSEYKYPANYYTGGVGGYTSVATTNFGFKADSYLVGQDDKKLDKVLFAENPDDYIISAGTPASEEGMESDVDPSYSVYSSHAYKVLPFDDENGQRMFKVTNPWNQSHRVIMDIDTLKAYFEDFTVARVNQEEANRKAA